MDPKEGGGRTFLVFASIVGGGFLGIYGLHRCRKYLRHNDTSASFKRTNDGDHRESDGLHSTDLELAPIITKKPDDDGVAVTAAASSESVSSTFQPTVESQSVVGPEKKEEPVPDTMTIPDNVGVVPAMMASSTTNLEEILDEETPKPNETVVSGVGFSEAAAAAKSSATKGKKTFLDDEEILERAAYLFPGLWGITPYDTRLRVDDVLLDALAERLRLLQDEVLVDAKGEYERLMKPENAIELCVALGLNVDVVVKRYEVVRNLQRSLGLKCKTSTIDSIRHLIYRLGVNNPFGQDGDFDGQVKDCYRGKKWLSFLGVKVDPNNPTGCLQSVAEELAGQRWENKFMHGTTGSALEGIYDDNGRLLFSISKPHDRHDFGTGFYCVKAEAEIEQPLSYVIAQALSFATDRLWFFWQPYSKDEAGSGYYYCSHNPAIVLLPNADEFTGSSKKDKVYHVGEKTPYKDNFLEDMLKPDKHKEYKNAKANWNSQDMPWKEFIKIARYYGITMPAPVIFKGLMHHCDQTKKTDGSAIEEPTVDPDRWVQYCLRYDGPDSLEQMDHLGENRVFIEFDVNWEEWLDDIDYEASRKDQLEKVKAGKALLEKSLRIIKKKVMKNPGKGRRRRH